MRDVTELVEGYRRFLRERYAEQAALYRTLAAEGQAPRVMVIACCDSRADPATIFSARPGELFVARNVANLVPPHERHGDYHGTSAALEFAVTGLQVQHILVMGHARCGGIQALLEGLYERGAGDNFITKWMGMMKPALGEVLAATPGASQKERQQALEQAGIRHSLDNLMSFPFVRERVESGGLRLHGAYFDIANGELHALDRDSGAFAPVV